MTGFAFYSGLCLSSDAGYLGAFAAVVGGYAPCYAYGRRYDDTCLVGYDE